MSIEDIINYKNEFDDNYVEENDEFLNFFDILNYFNFFKWGMIFLKLILLIM